VRLRAVLRSKRRERRDAAAGGLVAARTAERLAVLLAAGVAPASAWEFVAGERIANTDVPAAMLRVGHRDPHAWQGLAAAWTIASASGAPLAPTLRHSAASLRDLAQAARDASVALAGPVATARLVLVLPLLGLGFGLALGFDTVTTLVATPLGWACLGVGASLVALALIWNRSLVRRARPKDPSPGLACDLVAIALGGGASISRARTVVDRAATEFELVLDTAALDEPLALSRAAGVPAAQLLRSAADEARRDARASAQAAAARLGVMLMLPLGACILPAFFAIGVVPLLATVLTSTVGSF
jgi:tight adherence protein B